MNRPHCTCIGHHVSGIRTKIGKFTRCALAPAFFSTRSYCSHQKRFPSSPAETKYKRVKSILYARFKIQPTIQGTLVLEVGIRLSGYAGELRKIVQEHPRDKIVFKVRGKVGSIAYYEKALSSGVNSYSEFATKYPHGKPDRLFYYVEVENLQPSETYLIEIDTTSIEGEDTSNYALFVA